MELWGLGMKVGGLGQKWFSKLGLENRDAPAAESTNCATRDWSAWTAICLVFYRQLLLSTHFIICFKFLWRDVLFVICPETELEAHQRRCYRSPSIMITALGSLKSKGKS